MGIVVQKYGGSSVADVKKINFVASRIRERVGDGKQVVVVVSAMGDTTDDLLELASRLSTRPPAREMDALLATGEQITAALLALALYELGTPAVSLTGWQAGLYTDDHHRQARILDIQAVRIHQELANGNVVIVAGFQGLNQYSDITTLGRGGSDATAVALAAALSAEACEIYSDVPGVFTADPRLVPAARKLDVISYEEMLELAALGAQVLQRRSVEYAERHRVIIEAKSTFSREPGTLIKEMSALEKERSVTGIAVDAHTAKCALLGAPDRPGVAYELFQALATRGINVDMIIQSQSRSGLNDIAFTVSDEDRSAAREIADAAAKELGAVGVAVDADMAKVSVVGAGMASNPGVAATLFRALAEAGVNIEMISTSEIKISCLIRRTQVELAARAIHTAFQLDRPEP